MIEEMQDPILPPVPAPTEGVYNAEPTAVEKKPVEAVPAEEPMAEEEAPKPIQFAPVGSRYEPSFMERALGPQPVRISDSVNIISNPANQKWLEEYGVRGARRDGGLTELGQTFAGSLVDTLRAYAQTGAELGFVSKQKVQAIEDWQSVNQQLQVYEGAKPFSSWAGFMGYAGQGLGTMVPTIVVGATFGKIGAMAGASAKAAKAISTLGTATSIQSQFLGDDIKFFRDEVGLAGTQSMAMGMLTATAKTALNLVFGVERKITDMTANGMVLNALKRAGQNAALRDSIASTSRAAVIAKITGNARPYFRTLKDLGMTVGGESFTEVGELFVDDMVRNHFVDKPFSSFQDYFDTAISVIPSTLMLGAFGSYRQHRNEQMVNDLLKPITNEEMSLATRAYSQEAMQDFTVQSNRLRDEILKVMQKTSPADAVAQANAATDVLSAFALKSAMKLDRHDGKKVSPSEYLEGFRVAVARMQLDPVQVAAISKMPSAQAFDKLVEWGIIDEVDRVRKNSDAEDAAFVRRTMEQEMQSVIDPMFEARDEQAMSAWWQTRQAPVAAAEAIAPPVEGEAPAAPAEAPTKASDVDKMDFESASTLPIKEYRLWESRLGSTPEEAIIIAEARARRSDVYGLDEASRGGIINRLDQLILPLDTADALIEAAEKSGRSITRQEAEETAAKHREINKKIEDAKAKIQKIEPLTIAKAKPAAAAQAPIAIVPDQEVQQRRVEANPTIATMDDTVILPPVGTISPEMKRRAVTNPMIFKAGEDYYALRRLENGTYGLVPTQALTAEEELSRREEQKKRMMERKEADRKIRVTTTDAGATTGEPEAATARDMQYYQGRVFGPDGTMVEDATARNAAEIANLNRANEELKAKSAIEDESKPTTINDLSLLPELLGLSDEEVRQQMAGEREETIQGLLDKLEGIRQVRKFERRAAMEQPVGQRRPTDRPAIRAQLKSLSDLPFIEQGGQMFLPGMDRPAMMMAMDEELWAAPQQAIPSAETSINERKLPATFGRVKFMPDTVNADIGGGRFDNATEYLADLGVDNVIYDPFNRDEDWNRSAAERIAGGQADTATVNNALNVIAEPENRDRVIRQAADAVKEDGKAYFLIYEGDKTGEGRETTKGWQENRSAQDFMSEIEPYFSTVTRKGNLIIAENPIKERPAMFMAIEDDTSEFTVPTATISPAQAKKGNKPHDMFDSEPTEALLTKQFDAIESSSELPGYAGLPKSIFDEASPQKRLDAIVSFFKNNLIALHNSMPENLRSRARLWYNGSRKIAENNSSKYNKTVQQSAGVLAVLSPQKNWFHNVSQADQVMSIWENRNQMVDQNAWDQSASDIVSVAQATAKAKKGKTKEERQALDQKVKDERQIIMNMIRGKSVQELYSQYEKSGREEDLILVGWAIRTRAQAEFGRFSGAFTPEGDDLGVYTNEEGKQLTNTWGSINEITKAISILVDGSTENISSNLGDEHKVRNFYNNILNPNDQRGYVTIDTHAVAAAHILPFGASSLPVKHNFGSGMPSSSAFGYNGTYHIYAKAYRDAASELGLLPRELQSIVWEAVRGMYPAETKGEKYVKDRESIWQNNDESTARDILARQTIQTPFWARAGVAQGLGGVETGTGEVAGQEAVAGRGVRDRGGPRGAARGVGRTARFMAEGAETAQPMVGMDGKKKQVKGVYLAAQQTAVFFEGADAVTVLHEYFHHVQASGLVPTALQNALNKSFGDIDDPAMREEREAEAFTRYLSDGVLPVGADPRLAQAFDYLKRTAQAFYGKASQRWKLPDATKQELDRLFTGADYDFQHEAVAEATLSSLEADKAVNMMAIQREPTKMGFHLAKNNFARRAGISEDQARQLLIQSGMKGYILAKDDKSGNQQGDMTYDEMAEATEFLAEKNTSLRQEQRLSKKREEAVRKWGGEEESANTKAILDHLATMPDNPTDRQDYEGGIGFVKKMTGHIKRSVKFGLSKVSTYWNVAKMLDGGQEDGPFQRLVATRLTDGENLKAEAMERVEKVIQDTYEKVGGKGATAQPADLTQLISVGGIKLHAAKVASIYIISEGGNAESQWGKALSERNEEVTADVIRDAGRYINSAEGKLLKNYVEVVRAVMKSIQPELDQTAKDIGLEGVGNLGEWYLPFISEDGFKAQTEWDDLLSSVSPLGAQAGARGVRRPAQIQTRADISNIGDEQTRLALLQSMGRLNLNIDEILSRYVESSANYIGKARNVKLMTKVLENPLIAQSVARKQNGEFLDALKQIVRREMYPGGRETRMTTGERTLQYVRNYSTLSMLGYRITSGLRQIPSIGVGWATFVTRPKDVVRSLGIAYRAMTYGNGIDKLTKTFAKEPLKGFAAYEEMIKDHPSLKYRSFEPEHRDMARTGIGVVDTTGPINIQSKGFFKKFVKHSMDHIRFLDTVVVSSVYSAAKEHQLEILQDAVARGDMSPEQANKKAADFALRSVDKTQNPSNLTQRTLLQTENEFVKALNPFSGQRFINLNYYMYDVMLPILRDVKAAEGGVAKTGAAIAGMWNHKKQLAFAWAVPALMFGMIARRRLPEDEEEVFIDMMMYPFSSVPVVGSLLQSYVSGKFTDYAYDPTMIGAMARATQRTVDTALKATGLRKGSVNWSDANEVRRLAAVITRTPEYPTQVLQNFIKEIGWENKEEGNVMLRIFQMKIEPPKPKPLFEEED